MAKEEREPRKVRRGSGFGRYTWSLIFLPIKRAFVFGVLRIIGLIILSSLTMFLLSGGINQVKTGQTLVEYALDIGHNISGFLNSLLDGTSPFKFTDDGVYFKDADVPEEGALDEHKDIIDDDSKFEEWKGEWGPSGKPDGEGQGDTNVEEGAPDAEGKGGN